MDVDELIDKKLVHEIHTSGRKAYRHCRRSWDWTFRQNYYPKITAKHFEFGSAFHKAMETYYNPETWSWDRETVANLAVMEFVQMCEDQKRQMMLTSDRAYLDDEEEQDYEERIELGKGMLDYYFTRIAPVHDNGWTPVKVEISFMVPISNPHTGEPIIWCKCNVCWSKWLSQDPEWHPGQGIISDAAVSYDEWQGLPVVYAGRLDMLAQDDNKFFWIFDWKTAAAISQRTDFLYLDDQIGSYVWALIKLGLDVKGFVYHEQRKAYPQPPKRNKNRYRGCLFTTNKSEPLDYESYLHTVSTEDTEAYQNGFYDDMLTYLKNEGVEYFARYQVAKSYAELEEIERNIGLEALEMINSELAIYPAPSKFGCSWCAFQTPCLEKNTQGDYEYALDTMFEQREHYYIRNAPTTERSTQ